MKSKKCNQCKKKLDILLFTFENKEYSCCNDCRDNIKSKRKRNRCQICGIRAIFNYPTLTYGEYCKEHSQPGMIDVMNKKCIFNSCVKQPSYNYEGEKKALYCVDHKLETMVDVKSNICKKEACYKYASYNFSNLTKAEYCEEHSLTGMINIKSSRCEHENCNKLASYNYKEEKGLRFCSTHKLKEMVDRAHKKCLNCDLIPLFNYENCKKPLYCKMHSKEGMIDITKKFCSINNCKNIASFKNKDMLYCKNHKNKDSIPLRNRQKCVFEGCNIRPNYNFKGLKELYCVTHKLKDMIDVTHKCCIVEDCNNRSYFIDKKTNNNYCLTHVTEELKSNYKTKKCIIENCNLIPNFNYKNEKTALYCKEHSKENMSDITHKKCEKCDTRANYGYCGQEIIRCSKHKDENMFKTPKRTCIGNDEEDCKDVATYGIKEPTHCEEHSTNNEICLIASTCKECGRTDELLNKEGLCFNFCSLVKLDNDNKKHQKIKEITMLKYLDEFVKLSENIVKIQDDKIVNSYCNLYRPDRMYDCGTHIVIVECDEFQHKTKKICDRYRDLEHAELSRMHEIYNASGLPCIFLRWNPDNFRVNGMLNKKYNNKDRLKLLVKWIQQCFTMVPDKYITPVKYKYLFYDNFDETDISFLEIDDISLV